MDVAGSCARVPGDGDDLHRLVTGLIQDAAELADFYASEAAEEGDVAP